MEIRHAFHPHQAKALDTEQLRKEFLVEGLFVPDTPRYLFSLVDRMIVAGVCPVKPHKLEADASVIGAGAFLDRREIGIINLGGPGTVDVGDNRYELEKKECLYVGRGNRDVVFESMSETLPARFLLFSGPAHVSYPTVKASPADANQIPLGSDDSCNKRTIYQYIHPDGIRSCNVVMGFTTIAVGSVWNTMPCHTHLRRMELYCYFDLALDARVFHFMGEPTETRHLVVSEGEAVISPAWSIHSGAGTDAYSFVWGMLGDNQSFTDMDAVPMSELR